MKGWTLTVAISVALVALALLELLVFGGGEEGIRVLIRSSARTSILLFGLAFTASSLRRLWQTDGTRFLLANRRYVGVSYAVSHSLHLLALVALSRVSREFPSTLGAGTLVGGGIAYAFTYAMAFTSSDAAVRALGHRRWKRLHTLGGWYIWMVFAQSYVPRALAEPAYAPAALLALAIPAARLSARLRRAAGAQGAAAQRPRVP